jgi:hypothetical protein
MTLADGGNAGNADLGTVPERLSYLLHIESIVCSSSESDPMRNVANIARLVFTPILSDVAGELREGQERRVALTEDIRSGYRVDGDVDVDIVCEVAGKNLGSG